MWHFGENKLGTLYLDIRDNSVNTKLEMYRSKQNREFMIVSVCKIMVNIVQIRTIFEACNHIL